MQHSYSLHGRMVVILFTEEKTDEDEGNVTVTSTTPGPTVSTQSTTPLNSGNYPIKYNICHNHHTFSSHHKNMSVEKYDIVILDTTY